MHFWVTVGKSTWDSTWDLVIGQKWEAIIIAVFTFMVAFIVARIKRGKEYAKDWLFDAFAGIIGVIVVACAVFGYELFTYRLDSKSTNLIQNVWLNGDGVVFDHTMEFFSDPK